MMFHAWPAHLDALTVKDMAVNVLVYLPLGFFAVEAFAAAGGARWAIVAAVLAGFALSLAVETAQFFVVGRVSSAFDVTANTVGSALGAGVAAIWLRMPHRHTRRPDSMFVLCCWALAQIFPFVPHVPRQRPIAMSSPLDTLWQFGATFALLPVVASITSKTRSRRTILAVLLLLVPLRALVFTRSVTLAEIAIAAAALAIGWWMTPAASLAAPLLAAIVVIHGLAPFAFQSAPHAFSWTPFQASFFSDWAPALTILLGKLFVYSVLLWLIRESGMRLLTATLITAAVLASIEVAQMYLPGRSSEITDPVIAVIVGWVFASLRPRPGGLESVHAAR